PRFRIGFNDPDVVFSVLERANCQQEGRRYSGDRLHVTRHDAKTHILRDCLQESEFVAIEICKGRSGSVAYENDTRPDTLDLCLRLSVETGYRRAEELRMRHGADIVALHDIVRLEPGSQDVERIKDETMAIWARMAIRPGKRSPSLQRSQFVHHEPGG